MNSKTQYQKSTKKEKVEKLIYALSVNNDESGYFEIFLKDDTQILGSFYTIEYYENEPYIVLKDGQNHFYAIIKVDRIKLVGPRFFTIA